VFAIDFEQENINFNIDDVTCNQIKITAKGSITASFVEYDPVITGVEAYTECSNAGDKCPAASLFSEFGDSSEDS
jgi:hypothetical protein